jgi:hypothetical protein
MRVWKIDARQVGEWNGHHMGECLAVVKVAQFELKAPKIFGVPWHLFVSVDFENVGVEVVFGVVPDTLVDVFSELESKRNLKMPVKTRTLHLSEPYDSRLDRESMSWAESSELLDTLSAAKPASIWER